MKGKLDWVARIRPTAIVFGLMITIIAALVMNKAPLDNHAVWALLGALGGGLVSALTELIRKNGGE